MSRRCGARSIATALATAASCLVGRSGAESLADGSASEVVARLEYSGEHCASLATLQDLVLQRSGRVRFVDSAGVRRVAVSVRPPRGPDPWQAHVVIQGGGGPDTLVRDIEANTCGALMDAVGFVVAVTLDPPQVRDNPGPRDRPGATSSAIASNTAAKASAVSGRPAEQKGSSRPGASSSVRELTPAEARRGESKRGSAPRDIPEHRETEGRSVQTIGLGASVVAAPAPSPLPGAAVFWTISPAPSQARWGWWPEYRLSVAHHRGSGFGDRDGSAAFQLTSASFELCPWNLGMPDWGARPCAVVLGGLLTAQGSGTIGPERHARPWATLGGSLALHGALSDHWHLVVDVGGGTTLVRDRFVFEPRLLHQVPRWSAQASGGIALVLP